MMKRTQIKNGRVIDPANKLDAKTDIYIADGKIIGLDKAPDNFQAEKTIDANQLIVCPGLIDLSANISASGKNISMASEIAAAAGAGITSVCCPPDIEPIVDNSIILEWLSTRAKAENKTRVLVMGALTHQLRGLRPSSMGELKASGCVGISDHGSSVMNDRIRRYCFEYAATFGLKVFLTPEDYRLAEDGCVHEGIVSTRLGLAGIPVTAETIAVARDLLLIEQTGVAAHFSRLSTAQAVDMIAAAQNQGLPITADVAAHQLHLTEIDVSTFNSNCHVRPPLRSEADRMGLQRGLFKNIITAICSDHQPLDAAAKLAPFSQTEPGISALETLLPLTLRLANEKQATLSQALAWITHKPAEILGIDAGTLSVGAKADICIFDPLQSWTLTAENMLSHGKNTPFINWELQGKVIHTLVDGNIIYSSMKTS